MNKMLDQEREKKNYSFQETVHNRQLMDKDMRNTMQQKMRDKINKVEKTVGEKGKEAQHDVLIKREQRKLKEKDIEDRLRREKYKEQSRKQRILEKEANQSASVERIKAYQ